MNGYHEGMDTRDIGLGCVAMVIAAALYAAGFVAVIAIIVKLVKHFL